MNCWKPGLPRKFAQAASGFSASVGRRYRIWHPGTINIKWQPLSYYYCSSRRTGSTRSRRSRFSALDFAQSQWSEELEKCIGLKSDMRSMPTGLCISFAFGEHPQKLTILKDCAFDFRMAFICLNCRHHPLWKRKRQLQFIKNNKPHLLISKRWKNMRIYWPNARVLNESINRIWSTCRTPQIPISKKRRRLWWCQTAAICRFQRKKRPFAGNF